MLLEQVARVVEGAAGQARRRGGERPAGRDADRVQAAGRRHAGADRRDRRGPSTSCGRSLPADMRINPDVYQQTEFHRPEHPQRDRGAARRRHPGRHHPVPLPAELPHDVHHADGDSAVDRRHGARVQVVRHVDQHDDAGRAGRGHRRAGRRRDRGRREHLSPAAREPACAAPEASACGSSTKPAARSATRSCSARSSWCWCSCRCSRWAAWKAGCSRRWGSPTSCRSSRRWWSR